jgi:hypothetical protein
MRESGLTPTYLGDLFVFAAKARRFSLLIVQQVFFAPSRLCGQ